MDAGPGPPRCPSVTARAPRAPKGGVAAGAELASTGAQSNTVPAAGAAALLAGAGMVMAARRRGTND
ncbi:LPXTG cell wall anchor domain-containing protein [Streptomyces sp. NPDC087300]|uniref:LPXTG cell wall anchor domain-containing protein n=1 Tax=Streptomyces sp. NPDC087300 TaxID=3365780 RepID=UPI0038268827